MADFIWGANGARLTPDDIAQQRKYAEALVKSGSDYSPVQSPWQGLARLAQGLIGGYELGDAERSSTANRQQDELLQQRLLSRIGGGATPSTPTVPAVVAPTATGGASPSSYYDAIKLAESSGNPNATSSTSSATGLYQFTRPTWTSLMSSHPELGLTPEGITDPRQQEAAIRAFTTDNANTLSGAGLDTSPANLYAAHFLGAGGAQSVLRQPDSVPMVIAAGPSVVKANPFLKDMTVGDFKNWTASKVGSAVSPFAGTDVDPNGAAVTAPQATIQPVAQVQPQTARVAAGINPDIAAAFSPYASDTTRKLGTFLLQNQLEAQQKANDPLRALNIEEARRKLTPLDAPYTDQNGNLVQRDVNGKVTVLSAADKKPTSVSEYEYYKQNFVPTDQQPAPMDYGTWSTAKARAAATTINNNVGAGEDSFQKEAGKVQANRFNDIAAEGPQAKQLLSDVQTLTQLGRNIGTGKSAQLKEAYGPLAQSLGINVDGLSDIQAFNAIVNRVAPSLRVKGSGSQSDFELQNFLKSLPSLGNTPEGNEIAGRVMSGLQQNKIRAADIASQALNGEIPKAQADKMLRELPDPMEDYRAYLKSKKDNSSTSSSPQVTSDGWQILGNGIKIREKK